MPTLGREENNNGITFTEETFIACRMDGNLIYVEKVNGKIERWFTSNESLLTNTKKALGIDRVQK